MSSLPCFCLCLVLFFCHDSCFHKSIRECRIQGRTTLGVLLRMMKWKSSLVFWTFISYDVMYQLLHVILVLKYFCFNFFILKWIFPCVLQWSLLIYTEGHLFPSAWESTWRINTLIQFLMGRNTRVTFLLKWPWNDINNLCCLRMLKRYTVFVEKIPLTFGNATNAPSIC